MPKMEHITVRMTPDANGVSAWRKFEGDLELVVSTDGDIQIHDYAEPRLAASPVIFAAAKGAWAEVMSFPATQASENELIYDPAKHGQLTGQDQGKAEMPTGSMQWPFTTGNK